MNGDNTELYNIAELVDCKYGPPKVIPLWAVGPVLLYDLVHDGVIPAFTEALDVEDAPGVQPRLVPVYDEEDMRVGDLFVVVVSGSGRVGLFDNGNSVWVDANSVADALLSYEMGGE
ncbi:hypothetical protein [Rhizobium leguminosarum]|uniref:hypothetical protein n=1 Tax=Rhizobium leguminosarum TaxID=384 RepID=UPI001FE107AF|nr:hypothetical protein [Rhizobium leguminosarum]